MTFLDSWLPSRRDRLFALLSASALVNPLAWLLYPGLGFVLAVIQYLYAVHLFDWVAEGWEQDSGPPSAGRDDEPPFGGPLAPS